jgi:AraC-like DNA-binding protein
VLAIIVLALVWFTLVTHVHYKPIQAIIGKIEGYMARKSEKLGLKTNADEFKFIETAIDDLLQKSVDYENLNKEGRLLRQRTFLQELLEGYRTVSEAEWEQRMNELGMPPAYERIGVVVLEIDHYRAFIDNYKPGDQNLLKFLLETAFGEIAQQRGLFMWRVWVEPSQLAAAFHLQSRDAPAQDTLRHVCEEFRKWVGDNLELTVSAGIGAETGSIATIAVAYRNAKENVSYKPVFGTNCIIDNRDRETKTNGESFLFLQSMMEIVRYYRLDDERWTDLLARLIGRMQETLVSRADLAAFVHNLAHQLQKCASSLSPDMQKMWADRYEQPFARIAQETETLEELHERLRAAMTALSRDLEQERQSRKKHATAQQIKAYIDRHYADPDLSLIQVSERFGLGPRSVSNLSKETFGENFIDYLLKVRFSHAKQMLLQTDEPIQAIAEKVGYTHVISFHRAFKKMFDLPPGEYRSFYRLHAE